MALEVNFYSGSKSLYDAEPSHDSGGLYALTDGLGIYRGDEPVAGPCPVDIQCSVLSSKQSGDTRTVSGKYTSSQSLATILSFFAKFPGSGSRTLRISGLSDTLLMMKHDNVDTTSTLQCSCTDITSKDTDYVLLTRTTLILEGGGTFSAVEQKYQLIVSSLMMSELLNQLSEQSDRIDAFNTQLADLSSRVEALEQTAVSWQVK